MSTTELSSSRDFGDYDETKHVNYVLGMLLGVKDFLQEFAYLTGHDRRLARDAVGYGTLSGLRVTIDPDPAEDLSDVARRISVSCGSAITPLGYLVGVRPSQCAWINEWLSANKDVIEKEAAFVVPSLLTLYVVLGYDSCESDPQPIPGDPCRSASAMMIQSRVKDSFKLELRTKEPDQAEEDAIVSFVAWMQSFAVGGGSPYVSPVEFEKTLLESIHTRPAPAVGSPLGSPLGSPVGSPLGSPPGTSPAISFDSPPSSVHLDPAMLTDYMRVAVRVWVTRIRPLVHRCSAGGETCCSETTSVEPEDLVLLARIDVPIASSGDEWIVDKDRLDQLRVDESRRPIVAHNRLLQELGSLLHG